MKCLHFDYRMEIGYSEPVKKCCYTIKCIPKSNQRQRIHHFQIEMDPVSDPEWAMDSQGNRYVFGCIEEPHANFVFRIHGEAECGLAQYDEPVSAAEEMIYRHNHGFTVPGSCLTAYYHKILEDIPQFLALSPLEKARKIMGCLCRDFIYEKGITQAHTSAEEAMRLGRGVCQDYSHIMISLLRLAQCPARYVTGFLIGEGASHAWAEVADHGKWYGIDPTNQVMVGDSHIKLAVGRDAAECQINRAIMLGGGQQSQRVSVLVSEAGDGEKYLKKGALR